MRSSKSRSRSKTNRPRTLGNIINRVFDSSGPESKVRGTPQQIIEKYQMLARDAQLSNDRVAAENFSQHAEHYTRMLAEAMREMAAEQETRQQQYQPQNVQGGQSFQGGQNGQVGQNGQSGQTGQTGQGLRNDRQGDYRDRNDRDRNDRDRPERPEFRNDRADYRPDQRQDGRPEQRPDQRSEPRGDYRDDREPRDFGSEEQPAIVEVIHHRAADDTGLIETPEAPNRRSEAPKAEKPADAPREERSRRPRGPRKPKVDGAPDNPEGNDPPPREAAE